MNNFNAVFIGLIALTITVIIADHIISEREFQVRDPLKTAAIAERIRPLGQVTIAPPPPIPVTLDIPPPILPESKIVEISATANTIVIPQVDLPSEPTSMPEVLPLTAGPETDIIFTEDFEKSKKIYISACFVCHETGVAGAPKRGESIDWLPRISQGKKMLLFHVLNGFKDMPPRGASSNFTDEEITTAMFYLLLNFKVNP